MTVPLHHLRLSHLDTRRAVRVAAWMALLARFAVLSASAQTTSPPSPSAPSAQTAAKDDPERQQAIEVFEAGKYVEAMPLLEKLAVDHPEDATIKANWAFSVAAYAATLTDVDLRKKARIRARAIAVQAQKQGANTATVRLVLEIPEDGSAPAFSDRKDVEDAIKAAKEARNVADDTGRLTLWLDGQLLYDLHRPSGFNQTVYFTPCSVSEDLSPVASVIYMDDAGVSLAQVGAATTP